MRSTLKVNTTELQLYAMRVEMQLMMYAVRSKLLVSRLSDLDLDADQMKQINAAAERLEQKYTDMKKYMESGVLDMYRMAAKTYKNADII